MQRAQALTRPDLGHQRFWYWRGWRVRYTYIRPDTPAAQQQTPMLLVHGFGASLEQWRSNLRMWGQQRPVYALDLLGFGHSQKAAVIVGAEFWQEQLYDFWQALIGQPIVLVGHSLGALVALTAAARHPAMVNRLILLTLPLARQELVSGWLDRWARGVEGIFATPLLLRPLFSLVRQPGVIRRVLMSIYQRPDLLNDELVELFTRPTLERGAARTLCYLVKSRTKTEFSDATADLLQQVSIPVLLLWGTEDNVLPIKWGQQILASNPQITYRAIEGGGHCLYDEAPDSVDEVIHTWLETAQGSVSSQ
ncbi:alpha beta hydrolase [Leptolyngbya sp. Heron Island J]|uniref:alpha/beta fold hydrolase n=1 Tax=Leptolyngbya sp. Heron Island J TaxID=1385935 RepID=UPI0003B95050|nr:alpha/beta fold hydrolase [Leptolyngbya sp. Heron Island J]ESA32122.1 alpha beta hydrolase [Leptolyngbya sp. Heron Island J]